MADFTLDHIRGLSPNQRIAIHVAIRLLDQGSRLGINDDKGFNLHDSIGGKFIASRIGLTETEALDAMRLIDRYRAQIDRRLLDVIHGEAGEIPADLLEAAGELRYIENKRYSLPLKPISMGLPFFKWRPHQVEPILQLLESDKKFNALTAACGVGKSVLAVAIPLAQSKTAVVLTKQKSLQAQYVSSMPMVKSVEGMNNFNCVLPGFTDLTVNNAPCRDGFQCPRRSVCPYYIQRDAAMSEHIVVTNYDYAFASLKQPDGGLMGGRDWLIADEAQFLDAELTEALSITLLPRHLEYADRQTLGSNLLLWANWANDRRKEILVEYAKLVGEMSHLHDMMRGSAYAVDDKEYKIASRHFNRVKTDLKTYTDLAIASDSHIVYQYDDRVLFRPLWVRKDAYKLLSFWNRVLMMSATLPKADILCSLYGLSKLEFMQLEAPYAFPVAHRPVYVKPVARMNKDTWKIGVIKQAPYINRILDGYPNEKVLIHTHSGHLQAAIMELIADRHRHRLMWHDTATRAKAIDAFTKTKRPMVMLSPSMESGVDIPDLSVLILPKCLYSDLGDPWIRARADEWPEWYLWQTVAACAQALGRAPRDENHKAVSYILDSSFYGLYDRAGDMFPQYVKDALKFS